jgi:hypothetical protein
MEDTLLVHISNDVVKHVINTLRACVYSHPNVGIGPEEWKTMTDYINSRTEIDCVHLIILCQSLKALTNAVEEKLGKFPKSVVAYPVCRPLTDNERIGTFQDREESVDDVSLDDENKPTPQN